jgi:hypothetical protein
MAVRALGGWAFWRGNAALDTRTLCRAGRAIAPYALAAVLALLAFGLWGYVIAQVVDASDGEAADRREDVVAYYAAGRLLGDGRAADLYDAEAVAALQRSILGRPAGHHDGLAYMNPPFVAALFWALAELPYTGAQAVWFAVSALALIGALALLWPELRALPRRWAAVFFFAALASFPLVWSLLYGQISPLILLSWVLFYRALKGNRQVPAGLALAGALIKPQLALVPVLYLVTTRRWRALLASAAGGAALVLASVLLAGAHATLVAYPRFLLESLQWQQDYGVDRAHMFGWTSFLQPLLPNASGMTALGAGAIASAATLVLALVVWRRRNESRPTALGMMALATATILTSPHVHAQDLGILLVPAALLVAGRRDILALPVTGALFLLVPMIAISINAVTPALAAALAAAALCSLDIRRVALPNSWPGKARLRSAGGADGAVGALVEAR